MSRARFENDVAIYPDDMNEGCELRILQDDQGDIYVSVLPVGDRMGPSVRLCASGGADHVRGLLPALRAAHAAVKHHCTAPDGCEGAGRCHGPMKWCEACGDVRQVCDDSLCCTHSDEEDGG